MTDLLARIYENPDDDEARLVYADSLLEAGDVRGEFIALQLQRPAGAPASAREREILLEHQDAFLGPLAEVVRRPSFRRGFLSWCAVDVGRLASVIGAPEWGTVDTIYYEGEGKVDHRAWLAFAMHPVLRRLKTAGYVPTWLLANLAESSDERELEAIDWNPAKAPSGEQREAIERAIAECRGLPRLRALTVKPLVSPFPWLRGSRLLSRLEELSVHGEALGAEHLHAWLDLAAGAPRLTRFTIAGDPGYLHFLRGEEQRLSRLVMGTVFLSARQYSAVVGQLIDLLSSIDADLVSELAFRTTEKAPEQAAAVEAAARRHFTRLGRVDFLVSTEEVRARLGDAWR